MAAGSTLERPPLFEAGHDIYLSPFTYRYGSYQMRRVWSQENYWATMRQVWIAVAEVQQQAGLVTAEQVIDLKQHQGDLSVERIQQIEHKETSHDVVAAIREYKEVAPIGGAIVHQGMTSEDATSNTELILVNQSFDLLRPKLTGVLAAFANRIEEYKDIPCMGYTHLQAAEPVTVGYRFAKYAQDLLTDLQLMDVLRPLIKAKGIKGPVGTSAALKELLEGTGMTTQEHEKQVMEKLGLDAALVTDQTAPRKSLYLVQNILSNIAASLHHFALDMQLLQSSWVDEVSEPRRKGQVGSSAMPWKQNPINSENIDALTEMIPGIAFTAWVSEAFVTLERTLRDSAGKRSWLPESFLIIDEVLTRAEKLVKGMEVHEKAVSANMKRFAPFAATEIILTQLCKAGMNRQEAHEILRAHGEDAIDALRRGEPNPLVELILNDQRITSHLSAEVISAAFEKIYHHVGDAPERAQELVNLIRRTVSV